jgi:hypothetical protein
MSDMVLIVGGPHDGRRVQYSGKMIQLLVVATPSAMAPPSEVNPLMAVERATYAERIFVDTNDSVRIYAPACMGYIEAMRRLMQHYQPPPPAEVFEDPADYDCAVRVSGRWKRVASPGEARQYPVHSIRLKRAVMPEVKP